MLLSASGIRLDGPFPIDAENCSREGKEKLRVPVATAGNPNSICVCRGRLDLL